MKKSYRLFVNIGLLMIVVQFAGCRKLIDKYFPGHGGHSNVDCRLLKTIETYPDRTPTVGKYYYSYKNNPDSLTYPEETQALGTYFYFKYDAQHRLTQYSGYYSRDENDYSEIHNFVYEGNHIVADTTYFRIASEYTEVSEFEYDDQDRIVKVYRHVIEELGEPRDERDTLTYEYNAAGNLVGGTLVGDRDTFDDKVNYLRTSKVLMFLRRDYSVNNPFIATAYNDENLPLSIPVNDFGPGTLKFEYECK